MILFELFNQPAPIKKRQDGQYEVSYVATLSDGSHLIMTFFNDDGTSNDWTYQFGRVRPNEVDETGEPDEFAQQFDLSNEGNAIQVFQTAFTALRHFLKEKQPSQVQFTADKDTQVDPSHKRARLYDNFVRRFSYPGYQIQAKRDAQENTYVLKRMINR